MKQTWIKSSERHAALGTTAAETSSLLEGMHLLGFPRPAEDSGQYPAIQILDWVTRQQSIHLQLVLVIRDKLSLSAVEPSKEIKDIARRRK